MRRIAVHVSVLAFLAFVFAISLHAQSSACSGMSLGKDASLNGYVPFPTDNAWNQDISSFPVDPDSDAIINFIGPDIPVHPDFGAGLYNGQSIGIPYDIASGSPLVNIN